MSPVLTFILQPGIKSVYCQTLDKYVTEKGLETDDQKVIGELCLTDGVFLVGSKEHDKMLKDQVRIEAFRKEQIQRAADDKRKAEAQAKIELENIAKGQKAHGEEAKPTGADNAKVDEIRRSLEKEIMDKNKNEKRKK